MKFIVTGGCGFIGSNCVRLLREQGHNVVVVDKLTYAGDESRIEGVPLIRRGIEDVDWAGLLTENLADVIINYAAETHVDNSNKDGSFQFIESNVSGVYNLINGIRQHQKEEGRKVLLIQISTDEVYGSTSLESTEEFDEDWKYDPSNLYSATKTSAEHILKSARHTYGDLDYIICRGCNNYGPNQHDEKFLPTVIRKALNNEKIPIYGTGENIREWIWVEDFVRGHILAAEKYFLEPERFAGEDFNFGTGIRRNNLEMVNFILSYLNKSKDLMEFVSDRPGHDLRYAMNRRKAENVLGWTPRVSFSEGMKMLIDSYDLGLLYSSSEPRELISK